MRRPFRSDMDDEKIVTAEEYIKEMEEREEEALLKYPGRFDKCTFSEGLRTQETFTCLTCSYEKPFGFCYSCCISCHADHEVVEILNKSIRCDCGTKKMSKSCNLDKGEMKGEIINIENVYNHNFYGRYCRCSSFYDPLEETDIMFQCVLCEDWFHRKCCSFASCEEGVDFVCRDCVSLYPFLIPMDSPLYCLRKWERKEENHPSSHDIFFPKSLKDILCFCEFVIIFIIFNQVRQFLQIIELSTVDPTILCFIA
jgi:hypothetical protein